MVAIVLSLIVGDELRGLMGGHDGSRRPFPNRG